MLPGNAQHVGRRAAQEDAFAFSDLADAAFSAHAGAMCVVCDGMGGHAAGAAASDAAVKAFLAAYQAKQADEPIGAALLRAVNAANEAVLVVAAREGDSGSTLAAVVIHDGQLFWASVGDSRILLLRGGRLFRVNREHHYRAELLRQVARGEIVRAAADSDPRGEQLTSSLGERPLGAIDHCAGGYPLLPGDAVFVASDGLYKTLDEVALAALAAKAVPATPAEICTAWVDATIAQAAPEQDNVTVVGLQWPSAGGPRPSDAARPEAALRDEARQGRTHSGGAAPRRDRGDDPPHREPGPDRRRWRIALMLGAIALIGVLSLAWDLCCRGPSPQQGAGDDAAKQEQEGSVIEGPRQGGGAPASAAEPVSPAPASLPGSSPASEPAATASAKGAGAAPAPVDADDRRRSDAVSAAADRRPARGRP